MSKPNGDTIGTLFCFRILNIISLLTEVGIPTKPNSFASGITSIILLFFVCIETPLEPFLSKFSTISSLKSIKTDSTILIIFLSVTLKPLINFD